MIPIFIVAFRWGVKGGLLAGFLWGVLQIAVGTAYILYPVQGFIDYALAFTVLGFTGVFAEKIKQAVRQNKTKKYLAYIVLGVLLGCGLRFIAHYIAGVTFFESAIKGQPVWLYSLIYNASYMIPAFLLSAAVIILLFHNQPRALL